jgi:hypothetical protein
MYRAGSTFKFDYEHDGVIEKNHWFILANTYKSDFIFQLICIKGYHAGTIECYIKKESHDFEISKEHLIMELNRNFLKIHWDTFEDIEL